MDKFISLLGKIVLGVLTVLLIGYCWAFFEMKIMLKDNPELFNLTFYHQKSDNLAPQINVDDIAIVNRNSSYNVGDIVFFTNEKNEYKMGIVTYVDDFATSVKGYTENISNSAVLGRVSSKISYLGKLINFFKKKWFLVLLAIVGFTLVTVSQIMDEKVKKVS